MTTSTSPLANTPMLDTSDNSIIAVAVSLVIVVILLVVLGIILWRKKRLFGMQYFISIITTYISLIQFNKNNKYLYYCIKIIESKCLEYI